MADRSGADVVAAVRRRSRLVTRATQVGIVAVLVAGVAVGNVGVVVNAGIGLGVTFLPAVVERDAGITLGPRLTALIAAAVLLHALGMLWLYAATTWWDHLTHLLSAGLVAVVGYASVRAVDEHSAAILLPANVLFAFVLLITLAFGVLWEVLEFVGREVALALGHQPLLRQFGLQDTMMDLIFDAVGGVVAATYARVEGIPLADRIADRLGRPPPGDRPPHRR